MKYLKRYNEAVFVDKSSMKSDVEDILLELKDEGFETFVEISVEKAQELRTEQSAICSEASLLSSKKEVNTFFTTS